MQDKEKYQLEYTINSSSNVLFNFISTPSGLQEWFSDMVNVKKDVFTFEWDGSEEQARLLAKKDKEFIRFQWLTDEEEGNDTFFEFRVRIDSLTKDVALLITDFAEPDEKEEAVLLWNSQIDELKHTIGS
tara:strand:- start:16 stop:405 length:390 start_codon:yes stop_codon:yes gene_type:complete